MILVQGRLASDLNSLATCGNFVRREDGAAAVEFAIVAVPFIFLVLAVLQAALIFLASQLLETAVVGSSRLILTGQAQGQGMTQSTFAQAVCARIPALLNCNNLMIDVRSYSGFASADTSAPTLTFNSQGQVTNTWQYNGGSAGDIVVVRVMYQWPVLLGLSLSNLSNGNRLLMATAAFKNEPYP